MSQVASNFPNFSYIVKLRFISLASPAPELMINSLTQIETETLLDLPCRVCHMQGTCKIVVKSTFTGTFTRFYSDL